MSWVERMNGAVEYLEANLTSDALRYEEAARVACCSLYHLQRMFSAIVGIPLSEYVRRRRMSLAACDLQQTGDRVIDIAARYGYESPEAFARAFAAQHGVSPSGVRRPGIRITAYPRLHFHITIKGDKAMEYRIETKDAFSIYGIEGIFDTQGGENLRAIPQFWKDQMHGGALEALERSAGHEGPDKPGLLPIGAICGYREMPGTTFPYMLFTLRTPASDPGGYTSLTVPAATWAIFTTQPHPIAETSDKLQALIHQVYADWLPSTQYRFVEGYELEMYYMDAQGMYFEEAWFRVMGK